MVWVDYMVRQHVRTFLVNYLKQFYVLLVNLFDIISLLGCSACMQSVVGMYIVYDDAYI